MAEVMSTDYEIRNKNPRIKLFQKLFWNYGWRRRRRRRKRLGYRRSSRKS
jgi:hypothetical protein